MQIQPLNTSHRALLGMGVDSAFRRLGLGQLLIDEIARWTKTNTDIEVIDLQVITANDTAHRLYLRNGYKLLGQYEDMFRIDGQSVGYCWMAKSLLD